MNNQVSQILITKSPKWSNREFQLLIKGVFQRGVLSAEWVTYKGEELLKLELNYHPRNQSLLEKVKPFDSSVYRVCGVSCKEDAETANAMFRDPDCPLTIKQVTSRKYNSSNYDLLDELE